ncbi:hypothetical protein ED312_01035 [Sinomicrobium pectinilyticum]|uniref:Uncharacterized protein n=2 Tax=Sinomicrobium pectinilyticum TaxID=1084421 RepID=A0A3N0F4X8_SINP1|nr:hypothetical protein ED312_01035 [Sinomicrobium pectinilyticum]
MKQRAQGVRSPCPYFNPALRNLRKHTLNREKFIPGYSFLKINLFTSYFFVLLKHIPCAIMRHLLSLILICIFLLSSCEDRKTHPVQFYYWKSKTRIGETEKQFFEQLGATRLYLRLFDVDIQKGIPQPQAAIRSFDAKALPAEYIPVVFITNRTFTHISVTDTDKLAKDVFALVRKIMSDNQLGDPEEIQIDCDWTATTKDRFFRFLDTFRTVSGKKTTCTLRLHQVKYRDETGVPPADKVYLMAYATSSPVENDGKNSILDLTLLKDYLGDIGNYPLDFDVALPLYSWAVVTNHLGRTKLINGVTKEELPDKIYRKTDEHSFELQEDTFLRGIYLNRGFRIRVEHISPELLQEAKDFLSKKINKRYNYIYYHLDSLFLPRFSPEDLQ